MRKTCLLLTTCCLMLAGSAFATAQISPGAPGVFTDKKTQTIKLVVFAGVCRAIPYRIVVDGVEAMSGKLNLMTNKNIRLGNSSLKITCSAKHGISGTYLP